MLLIIELIINSRRRDTEPVVVTNKIIVKRSDFQSVSKDYH